MKIDAIRTRIVRLPVKSPLVTGNIRIESVWFLLVDLKTDDGASGSSYIWSFNKAGSSALKAVVEHLANTALGENPLFTARLWNGMWRSLIQWGHAGVPVMGMAAIDAAAWDLAGKVANQPLAQLLGRKLDRVPTYASGLWITDDLRQLGRDAEALVTQGFRAVKMRAGRADVEKDVAAVRAVRDAIGPRIGLMVDLSSAPTRDYATKLCHALEPFNLIWIEDPIADEDVADHAELARAVRTPICFGEKVYSPHGMRQIIDAKAADVLMADLQRAGGVTGWIRIAALADAARLPLSSHILPELNVHLVASAPTGMYLEHLTWGEELFQERLEMVDGAMKVPEGPGFGLTWNEDRIRPSLVDEQTFRL